MSDTAFAPPSEEAAVPWAPSIRVARLLAFSIDGALTIGVAFVFAAAIAVASVIAEPLLPGAIDVAFPLVCVALFASIVGISIAQWVGIAEYGRSFGKWCVGLKIVPLDPDQDLGFYELVGQRSWAFALAQQLTCGVSAVVDALWIFRSDGRCLHDHFAGTRVIADPVE